MRRRRARYNIPPGVRRQLSRRRWTRRGIASALALLALSVALDRWGVFNHHGDDWANYDRQVVLVSRVVDGDTVHVRRAGELSEDTIRLLGIDAPEVSHAPGGVDAHWGRASTRALEERIADKSVTVRLDATQTRDKYGRLLAYLYISDAENVNLWLVQNGHAYAHRIYPHSMQRQFEQAEDEARSKGRGLWAEVTEPQMPAWRQSWLAERRAARSRGW